MMRTVMVMVMLKRMRRIGFDEDGDGDGEDEEDEEGVGCVTQIQSFSGFLLTEPEKQLWDTGQPN